MTSDDKSKTRRIAAIKALMFAGLCETACFVVGLIAFFLTGNWIWIVIGIVAGAGFSLPALIKFVRETKGRDSAS